MPEISGYYEVLFGCFKVMGGALSRALRAKKKMFCWGMKWLPCFFGASCSAFSTYRDLVGKKHVASFSPGFVVAACLRQVWERG